MDSDSDYVPPLHTQPLQLAQSLAMASTITEADRSDLIEMLHELAERRAEPFRYPVRLTFDHDSPTTHRRRDRAGHACCRIGAVGAVPRYP
jgi:hypothetical protein